MKKKLLKTQDWSIQIRHKESKEEIVICNYASATSKKAVIPNNYPYGDREGWISSDDVINNYDIVKSGTPEDKVEHINSFRNRD